MPLFGYIGGKTFKRGKQIEPSVITYGAQLSNVCEDDSNSLFVALCRGFL